MHDSLPDERLVEKILDGDKNAFSHLYARYHAKVYGAAYRIIRNPEESKDAAQEIFIKLYRFLRTWDARKSKLSTWIHRLAVNHAIDHVRTRNRRAESPLSEMNPVFYARATAAGPASRSPYSAVRQKEEIDVIAPGAVIL